MMPLMGMTGFTQASHGVVEDGLQIHLDPGLYDSTQTWADESPAGNDFYLGETSSSESRDPTFVAGPPAYFSLDGDDRFRIVGAHPQWIDDLHKNSQSWSFCAVVYPAGTSRQVVCGTYRGSTYGAEFVLVNNASGGVKPEIQRKDTSGQNDYFTGDDSADPDVALNTWSFIGCSYTEGLGSFLYANGVYWPKGGANTFDAGGGTNTNETSGTFHITCDGAGGNEFDAGGRIGVFLGYNRAISKAEMDQNCKAIGRRYGI